MGSDVFLAILGWLGGTKMLVKMDFPLRKQMALSFKVISRYIIQHLSAFSPQFRSPLPHAGID